MPFSIRGIDRSVSLKADEFILSLPREECKRYLRINLAQKSIFDVYKIVTIPKVAGAALFVIFRYNP